MRQNGHYDSSKSVLIKESNYLVDFRPSHTINGLLGFNKDFYSEDFQESEKCC